MAREAYLRGKAGQSVPRWSSEELRKKPRWAPVNARSLALQALRWPSEEEEGGGEGDGRTSVAIDQGVTVSVRLRARAGNRCQRLPIGAAEGALLDVAPALGRGLAARHGRQ